MILMPRYEYICEHCQRVEETTRSMEMRDAYMLCKNCGYEMKRSIVNANVQFKGKGFYKTGG